jgi:hypothetical protein
MSALIRCVIVLLIAYFYLFYLTTLSITQTLYGSMIIIEGGFEINVKKQPWPNLRELRDICLKY